MNALLVILLYKILTNTYKIHQALPGLFKRIDSKVFLLFMALMSAQPICIIDILCISN